MNERDFKAKLRSKFKQHCYIQSMSSLGTAGTPDLWLSGRTDLWIEVKYDDKTKGPIKPKLSSLQAQWLNGRRAECRSVCVLVGTSPNEAILYRFGEWNDASNERKPLSEVIERVIRIIS